MLIIFIVALEVSTYGQGRKRMKGALMMESIITYHAKEVSPHAVLKNAEELYASGFWVIGQNVLMETALQLDK